MCNDWHVGNCHSIKALEDSVYWLSQHNLLELGIFANGRGSSSSSGSVVEEITVAAHATVTTFLVVQVVTTVADQNQGKSN